MSNDVTLSLHERKESDDQSTRGYQSVWMARWGRTGKAASDAQNTLSVDHKLGGNSLTTTERLPYLSVPDTATDTSHCGSKELTEVPVADTANGPDESMTVVSEFSRKERSEHERFFPMFGLSKSSNNSMLALKHGLTSTFNSRAVGPLENEQSGPTISFGDLVRREKTPLLTPSAYETEAHEHCFNLGGRPHFVENNSLAVSASFKNDLFASSSRYPMDLGASRLVKVNESNSFSAKGHFIKTSLEMLKPGKCDYHVSSSAFVHQQDNDPSMSRNQVKCFLGNGDYDKSVTDFHTRFFQSQASSYGVKEAQCSSRPRDTFIDVETMRIQTTTASVEASKIHQSMKELFFSEKKTSDNLSMEGKLLRESNVSSTTQVKGDTNDFTEVLGLSREGGFDSHHQGEKLQPLWSSIDDEEMDNAIDIKNESSAETNTMDFNALKDDHLYGASGSGGATSLLSKDPGGFRKLLASRAAAGFTSEDRSGRGIADQSRPNRSYLALPSAMSCSADDEPSTSKTQSLDAAHLLPDVDDHMATDSKLKSTEPDPESRWMKRLKVGTSEPLYARGTKISKMEEASSFPELSSRFQGRMIKRRMTSSDPLTSERTSEKKPILYDLNDPMVMKDGGSDSTSNDMVNSGRELLSHSWIRRWCRRPSDAQEKATEGEKAACALCDPQSLKDSCMIEKKQFPSIAAMALMGKVMNGFHPCEFKRRGSLVVWNTSPQ